MNIREMCTADLEQVYTIEEKLFSIPWSKKSFEDALANSENIYLVAQEENQILGYCGLWGVVGEGQITNVAVDKMHQKKGIGGMLLAALLDKGEKKGIGAYTLEVRESNKPALALYEKFNFKNVGIRKNYYEEPTEHAVIMWRNQGT